MFKQLIKSPALRRRTSWAVAMVLILPFVFFFHASNQAPIQGPGGTAGIIFGKEISWNRFEEERVPLQQRFETQFAGVPAEFLRTLIVQSTWDRLIILEEAKRTRLRVDDTELAASIRTLPDFQQDGRFVPALYHSLLRASGLSPQTFEARIRKDLLAQQLIRSVRNAVTVSDEELLAAYHKAHDMLRASMVLMETASFQESVAAAITDEDLQTYYDERTDVFRLPEQLMFEYAVASRDDLAKTIELTDEEVRAFYDEHPAQFVDDEVPAFYDENAIPFADGAGARPGDHERRAGEPRPFDDVREAIRTQLLDERLRTAFNALAMDLEGDLETGLRFDEIVLVRHLTRHTAGPLPVDTPGITGALESRVLRVVDALTPGAMSRIIETDTEIVVARLTKRIPPRTMELLEVRDRIREQLVRERTRAAAREAADELHGQLTDPDSELRFEEVLRLAGVSPREVEWSRTEPIEGMGQVAALNEAAFSAAPGTLTEVIETPSGLVILRPEEMIPADETKLAEIEETFRQDTLTAKQGTRFQEWLVEVRARAKLESFVDTPRPSM